MTENLSEITGSFDRELGPHRIPRIDCTNCGTEHHPDAANGKYIGHCQNCGAFLRRPTETEEKQFTDFICWKGRHMLRED